MPRSIKYLLALLPGVLTVGGWLAAIWAVDYFACQGNFKNLQPCYAWNVNIVRLIGTGLFWCYLLMWIAVPCSVGAMIYVWVRKSSR